MDPILKSKLHRLVRMSFQDIYANAYASGEIWQMAGKTDFKVGGWAFRLGESNAGTLQLICVGIETFGRVLLGYTNERGKSEEAFVSFMALFPAAYHSKAKEIYSSYRCGFLHSQYLGYDSIESGFFPTRAVRSLHDSHLEYANRQGDAASSTKNKNCFRLILNIDTFLNDFRGAVEEYLKAVETAANLSLIDRRSINVLQNTQIALKGFPQEDCDLLALPNRPNNRQVFGDKTLIATQTSYPLTDKKHS